MALDNNMRLEDPGKLLQEYQSGQTPLSPDEKPKVSPGSAATTPEPELAPPTYRDILRSNRLSNTRTRDFTEEAKEAGFGMSKYDTDFFPGMDLEQSRAIEQSGFSKIGTGLVKGGITAATTAVNTTLGTVFGLGSALYSLADVTEGESKGFMDVMDAGVNNWLSNQLVKIQNWAEEQFPNYRTEEERSEQYQREWWKHMGTANFIGDSILKNFGFTVGAMAGGMAWSKLLGAGLSKQLANDIMKGAVAAAEGDSEAAAAMRLAAEAVKKGTATEAQTALARAGEAVARGTALGVDADALVLNIENAAKAINKYGAKLQLYGAAVGAMGEGTVEGIMAKNEFLENYNRDWEEQYSREYRNLERDILESGNTEWVSVDTYELPDGTLQKERVLTPEGLGELYKRQQETTAKYQAAKEYAEEQGDRLSSTTFLLNLPILTASNSIQFGRMLSGGWQTSRNAAGTGITGGLRRTAEGLSGAYRATGNTATRTILGSLKVAGAESFEEMAQGTVSSGAKEVASRNLASFNNDGYDAQAVDSVREWFSAMTAGGSEYLGDVKNWQEGAIGALTGLFGIPGRRWQGGVIGEYRDAKERTETDRATAETLNNLVSSKEFQDRWHGYIRHLKYDNDMANAVANDDEYAWHTADDNQLISDVIMFADANRLQDLNEIVSEYGSMSIADATQLKDAMKSDTAKENDWVRNASPEEIVDKVKKQADRMKTAIDQYKRFYDAMKSRAPMNASPELIKEMVFTAQEIKAYENRFLTMFGETMTAIEPLIEIQSVFNKNGQVIEDKEEQKKRFEEVKRSYESIFSMMGLPIKIPKAMRDETQKVLDFMETFAEGDDQLVKKIQDMRKLSNSRNVFYEKLITLQEPKGQEEHEVQAITPQKVEEKAAEQMNAIETEELTTMDAVRQKYLSKNAKDRIEFLKTLDATSASNPSVKNFLDIKNLVDGFSAYMASNSEHPIPEAVMKKFADDFLRKASSVDDVKNLPDSIFTPYEEYAEKAKSPFVSPSQAGYARQKQEIREEMQKYLGLDSSTKTRNTLNPVPAPAPVRTNDENPTGQDASQPGSMTPKPQAAAQTPAPKEETAPKPAPVQPQVGTGEVTPLSEELGQTPMAEPVTKQDVAEEAYTVEVTPVVPGEEKEIDDKAPYYHQSVPEVDSEQAKLARTSVEGRKTADLSDFVNKHPKYADTWNALSDAGAFAYTATQLAVNDVIDFIIDPSFPKYNDRYQILMATRKNGELQILTPLSQKNAEYLGLRELKDAIEKEYRSFIDVHPNDVFVFSQHSRVWAKRAGQIEYNFADDSERGIQNIPDYSEKAPIIFINRNGDAQVVRGEADAMDKIASGAFDASFRSQRRGAVYYLVDDGTGSYIPVRLFVEHFKRENVGSDNPMFVRVKTILSSIAGQTENLTKEDVDYEKENQKLRSKMEQLVKLLDLHDMYLEFGNYENIGPAMKIVTWREDENGAREEIHDYRRPEQMSDDWLIGFVADKNASFQIRQDEDGKMDNLDDYIENDILTSNAMKLRAKGVDFYVDPWDTNIDSFKAMTSEQVAAQMEQKAESAVEKPIAPEAENLGDSTDDEDINWADDDYDDSAARKNNPAREVTPTPAQEQEIQLITTMDKLDAEVRKILLDSGWTEEEFNNAEQEVKERAVECAGAAL